VASRDEDRELQGLLRNLAGIVMLVLLSLIVVVAISTPRDSAPDTTLLLGLAASITGACATFLGVTIAINRGKNGNGEK
jgi:type IV secretory pathway VirB2 component (pilin)